MCGELVVGDALRIFALLFRRAPPVAHATSGRAARVDEPSPHAPRHGREAARGGVAAARGGVAVRRAAGGGSRGGALRAREERC